MNPCKHEIKTINLIIAKYFNDEMDIIPIKNEKIVELSKLSYADKKENLTIVFYDQLSDMYDPFQSDLKQWFDEIYIPYMKTIFANLSSPTYITFSHKDKIFLALVADREQVPNEGVRFTFQTGTFFGIPHEYVNDLVKEHLEPFMQFIIDYIKELSEIRKHKVFEVIDEQLEEDAGLIEHMKEAGYEGKIAITQLNGEYHCKCGNDDSIVDDPEIGIHCLSCGGRYIRK